MTLPLDIPELVQHESRIPIVTFVVWGVPIPKGSMRAVQGPHQRFPIVKADNSRTRPWQALITDAAHQTGTETFPCPVVVRLRFTMPRPKSRPKRDRWPDRKPDLDKLIRAALDGLKGPVYRDDAQVVRVEAEKVYVGYPTALREPGMVVEVQAVTS